MTGVQAAVDAHPSAELSGVPPMFFITFKKDPDKRYKKRRTSFYTHLIRQGVFMQPYHHGYVCYRHTDEDIERTLQAVDRSLSMVASDS